MNACFYSNDVTQKPIKIQKRIVPYNVVGYWKWTIPNEQSENPLNEQHSVFENRFSP